MLERRKNIPFHNPILVGFVIIKNSTERTKYIQECIRLGRISVILDNGTVYQDCPVMNKDFSLIVFPEKVGQLGTAVVLSIPAGATKPIVLGVLPNNDIYPYIQNEKQDVKVYDSEESTITVDNDPKNGVMLLSIYGKSSNKGNLNISVGSQNNTAQMSVDVQGTLETNVTKKVTLNIEEELDINIRNKKDNDKFTNINWNRETGLVIKDEFDNIISLKEIGGVIEVAKIRIGGKAGGETVKALLLDLISAIEAMTLSAPGGVTTAPPINDAQFIAIKNRISTFMGI